MIGLSNCIKFNRSEGGWVSSFVHPSGIIEPLAETTFNRVMPILEEFVPEHCITVTTGVHPKWMSKLDKAYFITITFDNEADEAEFIMRVIS